MYCKAQQFTAKTQQYFLLTAAQKKYICLPIWKIEKIEKLNERIPQEKNIRLQRKASKT